METPENVLRVRDYIAGQYIHKPPVMGVGVSKVGLCCDNSKEEEKDDWCIVVLFSKPIPPDFILPKEKDGIKIFTKAPSPWQKVLLHEDGGDYNGWAGLCEDCHGNPYTLAAHICPECGQRATNSCFKRCALCAQKQNKCSYCSGPWDRTEERQ